MLRRVTTIVFFVGLLALTWDDVLAQDAGSPKWPPAPFSRGDGGYLDWLKVFFAFFTFVDWVRIVDWVNRDNILNRFNDQRWVPVVSIPFLITFVLLFFVPYFWVMLPISILASVVPALFYVRFRNAKLEMHERVLTPDHFRFLIAERLRSIGFKVSLERKRPQDMGPEIDFTAMSGETERDNAGQLLLARQQPGWATTRELFDDVFTRRADAIMMDFTSESVGLRYEIDGVWHNGEARDRESGDALLATVKTLASTNPSERRARQTGEFEAAQGKSKRICTITSQGTKTGERAVIRLENPDVAFPKLADIGMREKMREQFMEVVNQESGLVVISAPPRGGLSTTYDAVLGSMDRLVRSFAAVEDSQQRERSTENVPVTYYDSAKKETPVSVLTPVIRLYPDVISVRNVPDLETIKLLCAQTKESRVLLMSARAKETAEALIRVMMLKIRPAEFGEAVTAVLNQRLIRKLCETCKEAYTPPPQVLQQLRIPANKVEAFYRPPQQPEEVCPDCGGIGYVGRTGLFELMIVDEALRKVIAKTPKLDLLRQQARKSGMRTLQEEGILLVVRGITSLPELTRVLKS